MPAGPARAPTAICTAICAAIPVPRLIASVPAFHIAAVSLGADAIPVWVALSGMLERFVTLVGRFVLRVLLQQGCVHRVVHAREQLAPGVALTN